MCDDRFPGKVWGNWQLFTFLSDIISQHPNPSAEKARTVLAVEAAPGELVGDQAARQPAPGHPNSINFYSLKQWGNELKWVFGKQHMLLKMGFLIMSYNVVYMFICDIIKPLYMYEGSLCFTALSHIGHFLKQYACCVSGTMPRVITWFHLIAWLCLEDQMADILQRLKLAEGGWGGLRWQGF